MSVVVGWGFQHHARELSWSYGFGGTKAVFFFSSFRIQFMRDLHIFFGTSFKVVPANPEPEECATGTNLIYSCYGTGYTNANRTLA